ncbi:hypothetical protein [Actinomyces sp. zg328]|uniref:hypothetical protein n=1 Tax=Actinomyces sp. zg328 TaxID=2609287 RepID=UPI0013573E27|nr:hypothetical protein [Actinomyces sp. zg328]
MALRFNPPPNWPAPPEGFVPPAGWQPDPAWGPAPEGWQLWVEDSGGAASPVSASAPGASDPAWAPTQAVQTGQSGPVADPTGQSASAPSADYAPAGMPAPMGSSAPGSPYAAEMNYAQAPTPFHGQAQPVPGAGGGWQPVDVPGGASAAKPVYKQWWFFTIIGVVVVALIGGLVWAFAGGDSDEKAGGSTQTSAPKKVDEPGPSPTGDESEPSAPKTAASTPSSPAKPAGGSEGTSMDNPKDTATGPLTFHASKYDYNDPNASLDVTFGKVNWDATADVKSTVSSYSYKEPGPGQVYIRVPIDITYHGKGQYPKYSFKVDFVHNGTTTSATQSYSDKGELSNQAMPRDGGKASGYATFLIDKSSVNQGVFAVTAFTASDEGYVAAK